MLVEFDWLSKELSRSKSSAENASRFFTLIAGGTLAAAAGIAGFTADRSPLEFERTFMVGGSLALLLALVGFFSASYVAHERGWRVEILHHLGSIRDYFRERDPRLAGHLTLGGSPSFLGGWVSGDATNYWTLASITTFLLTGGAYLIVDAGRLASSYRTSETGPSIPWWILFGLPVLSLLVHGATYYLIMKTWESKWQRQNALAKEKATSLQASK